MSYIDSNLMSGEQVIYRAKIHWAIFLPSFVYLLIGIWIVSIGENMLSRPGQPGIAPALVFFGQIMKFLIFPLNFIKALIAKLTTELGLTSKRVIVKIGLIRRETAELNHSKVESFRVDQTVLGRLLGYGTIVVQGTGGGRTPIRGIDSPLVFRRQAMEIIDNQG
ncbi:MAG: PH domain-containing protein [Pseudomonadota bacterium]